MMFNTFYQVWGERAIDGGNAGTRTRTLLAQSHVAPKTLAPAWGVVIIHGKDFDALHASLQKEAFDAVILCAKAPHTQQFGYVAADLTARHVCCQTGQLVTCGPCLVCTQRGVGCVAAGDDLR